MTLSYSIDRLDFARLVAEAQRRIAPESRGQWTLHAPVDPGITLIELFAWLLDQRSFLADQVSDSLQRALLALLGVAPLPARPAGVAVVFPDDAPTLDLPARTKLRVDGAEILFTTIEDRSAVPIRLAQLWAGGADRARDLDAQRPVALLPAHGQAGEARIVFRTAVAFQRPAYPVSLAFELVTPRQIQPHWSTATRELGDVPPPATLAWWYRRADGSLAPLAVADGTQGLRRSGVVAFPFPAEWGTAAGTQYELVLTTAAATFTSPPLVTRIVANAAIAEHRRYVCRIDEPPPWLPLPFRSIELPVDKGRPLPETVKVEIVERDGEPHGWTLVDDLASASPDDRAYVVDRERCLIRFGDGLTGRVPHRKCVGATEPQTVTVSYQSGGGVAGMVGPCTWVVGEDIEAKSFVDAGGGAEAESLEEARIRAAAVLSARTRAVTAEDYVTIARETPGVAVARAYAAVGFDPDRPCRTAPGVVTVFVVPEVPLRRQRDVEAGTALAAPAADPGLLRVLERRFAEARLVGTLVPVRSAAYRRLQLAVRVEGDPYDPEAVRRRAEGHLRRYLDPLLGGDDGTGFPFGGPLRPTALLRVTQDALGTDAEVTAIQLGLDDERPQPACGDVALRPFELVQVTGVAVSLVVPTGEEVVLR